MVPDPSAQVSVASIELAPRGFWFSYRVLGASRGLGRIVDGGAYLRELERFWDVDAFSPDGTRVIYSEPFADDKNPSMYVDLPDGEPTSLTSDVPDAQVYTHSFSLDRDHILANVDTWHMPGPAMRLHIPSGKTTPISSPERKDWQLRSSVDGSAVIAIYWTDASKELELIDPLGESPPRSLREIANDPMITVLLEVQAAGTRHLYYAFDDRDLTFVAWGEGGEAAISVVSEPEESGFACLPHLDHAPPQERFAAIANGGQALVLVDLSKPLAERVGRLEPQQGGVLGCPRWNEARDKLAFVEQLSSDSPVRSLVYTLDWTSPGAPPTAELVHESELELELVAYEP